MPTNTQAQIAVDERIVNDPLFSLQDYLSAHNIPSTWRDHTIGNTQQRIAIHSLTGFSANHEDMVGRTLNPFVSGVFLPEEDIATELAGIIGANANNSIGIAGINWKSKLKSYNALRMRGPGDDNNDQAFVYDGVEYYFDFESLETMMNQSILDQMDINLFTYNMPSPRIDELDPIVIPLFSLNNLGGFEPVDPMDFNPESSLMNKAQNMLTNFLSSFTSSIIDGPQVGASSPLRNLRNKIAQASLDHDAVNVAAVGDVNEDSERLLHVIPAAFDSYVLTVAGAELMPDYTIQHWEGSMAAPYVDVAAVSNNLVTTSADSINAYNLDFNSTTGAAAIAAGVVSLMKDVNPDLKHDDIEEILKITTQPITGSPGINPDTGHGLIDARAALDYITQNEILHVTAQASDVEVLENELYGPPLSSLHLPSPGTFVNFSGTYNNYCVIQCVGLSGSRGKLNRIVGKIDFEGNYSEVADAWLRITSSGIDTTAAFKS